MIIFGTSCETDPDINLDMQPDPVFYAIFDKADTVSKIYLTKSFSGDPMGPYYNAKIFDSIYYKDVDLRVVVYFNSQTASEQSHDGKIIIPDKRICWNKSPGVFSNQYVEYVFNQSLVNCLYIVTSIRVPGKDKVVVHAELIDPPEFTSPTTDNSNISLQPNLGFIANWKGNYWNEFKLSFVVLTKTTTSLTSDTLVYFKKGINLPDGEQNESFSASFSYGAYLGLLNSGLKNTRDVEYRKVVDISVKVSCGNRNFKEYMDQYNVQTDNVPTATPSGPVSLFASKSTAKLKGLKFDQSTIEFMKQDPQLEKFKFVYY